MRPATLTTTASLSATDPAIFLHSAAGCKAGGRAAGDVGRSSRAGIPGRSCAGRGRGSENGSGAHTHAGTRTRLGPRRRPGWQAQEEGEGTGRRRRPRGRRCPLLPRPWLYSRRSFQPQGAPVSARRRKVAKAALRWPWAAFKGNRSSAWEPGTGRGPGYVATACSACPAPRPLDSGRRLGREGWACQGRGVREDEGLPSCTSPE